MAKNSSRRRKEDKPAPALEHVLQNFVACDRCSFFLAGYRVIHGVDNLENAAKEIADRWLSLSWNDDIRQLLQDSYGGRLDLNLFYYDSQCPSCRRRFLYKAAEEKGEEPLFRIEIK